MSTALKVCPSGIPAADTVTVFVPGFGPNVRILSALPFVLVAVLVVLSVPSPDVTVNVTGTPSNATPCSSRTATTNGSLSAAPGKPCWSFPETM